jgi:hypothetical protein
LWKESHFGSSNQETKTQSISTKSGKEKKVVKINNFFFGFEDKNAK